MACLASVSVIVHALWALWQSVFVHMSCGLTCLNGGSVFSRQVDGFRSVLRGTLKSHYAICEVLSLE